MVDLKALVGRAVTEVRRMTREEVENEGWAYDPRWDTPAALVLDDGTVLFASQDHEGNGPGAFFGNSPGGEDIVRDLWTPESEEAPKRTTKKKAASRK